MSRQHVATITGAEVLPGRLDTARKASASRAGVEANAALSNSTMDGSGALLQKPVAC